MPGRRRKKIKAILMRTLLFTLILLFSAAVGKAQDLSRTEAEIAAAVSRNAPEAIAFLERVVNINSGTLNLEGVREVGEVFGEAFREIGFETRWIPMPEEMNRAGHLFAEIGGGSGNSRPVNSPETAW